ncbi:50S ribosomal protein L3 N(5)-glutamine methyltransferase [Candidatus Magnetaquicoccus inordinatus]|uniref:50S ribosomal protein L3 N(5)-glutamine methyltransferase n=1 Tax=Candidatus Magnetaquicoccus inordinatus TaxID=2496818 RepID=UPI00187D1BE9|nr:50S ribosomal protein L3 N(5)-glutamine methyltransferase [Candidatus Magnetaquicoccus inordinatus]
MKRTTTHRSTEEPAPAPTPRTIGEWLHMATAQITATEVSLESGMQEACLEAEFLVYHALLRVLSPKEVERLRSEGAGRRKAAQVLARWQEWLRKPPPPGFVVILTEFLQKRLQQRIPAAYVVGEAPFAGHLYLVTPDVLIPRSRIENMLLDRKKLYRLFADCPPSTILDLGTGSGCLAIAFAMAFPKAQVDGVDISPAALAVAAANGRRFKMEGRVHWRQSDLFAQLGQRRYGLIVSNPPYVDRQSMAALPPEYLQEPALALDGGEDGLAVVEPILRQAADYLTDKGLLVCEVGDVTEQRMRNRWPDLSVEWIPFHFQASGVFVARKESLATWARATP